MSAASSLRCGGTRPRATAGVMLPLMTGPRIRMNNGSRRAATTHDDRIPLLSTGRHRAIYSGKPVTTEYERSPFNMTRDHSPSRVLFSRPVSPLVAAALRIRSITSAGSGAGASWSAVGKPSSDKSPLRQEARKRARWLYEPMYPRWRMSENRWRTLVVLSAQLRARNVPK
jgi:hypothetical protein